MSTRYTAPVLPHYAALYVRVSDPSQAAADKTSPQTQEDACRAAALRAGYPDVRSEHIYRDGLESRASGEELYQRPGLDRLRSDAKRGAFRVVYINTVERLARDPIHQGIVIQELAEAGVSVEFVAEPLHLDTPEGQMLAFMKAYAGKIESERRRERVMRSLTARASKGLPIRGCRPPYGFAWGPERDTHGQPTYTRLIFDPLTAPIRRRLFTEVAQGATLRDLASRLIEEGIPTPSGRGNAWYPSTIRMLVTEPLCWGEPVALRTETEQLAPSVRKQYKYKSHSVARSPAAQVPLPATILPEEPLVSPALAAAVAARLEHN